MAKNDERIIALKEAIAKKKEELGKVGKFVPVTNCSLHFQNNVVNLHTLGLVTAISLLIELNMVRMSAEDLGMDNCMIGDYSLSEWMTDIKAKIDMLKVKDEKAKLREMEFTLDKLMSEEKRTELELDEIESLLK